VRLLILILSLLLITGCCRNIALYDAEWWACQGYQTRIAAYNVGGDGYIIGFPHSLIIRAVYGGLAHAQAQVWKDGRWWWVEYGQLMEGPQYSMVRKGEQIEKGIDYYFWKNHEFMEKLTSEGFSVPKLKPCK
jgi:hypothetical protein